MKIRLYSDLHLEFYDNPDFIPDYLLNPDDVDVLILAGDIHVGLSACVKAINKFAAVYPNVLFVPGNHEFYHHDIDSFDVSDVMGLASNAQILAPGVAFIGHRHDGKDAVRFIGATLWSNLKNNDPNVVNAVQWSMNDFRTIKNFDTEKCMKLHARDMAFIKHNLEQPFDGKTVVVTHFLPARVCHVNNANGRGNSLISNYYANGYDQYIYDHGPDAWFWGHSHDAADFTLNKTRMISNPHCYPYHESQDDFKSDMIYEI